MVKLKKKDYRTLLQKELSYIEQVGEMIDNQSAHTNKRWNAESLPQQYSTDNSRENSPIYLRIKILLEWYVKKATNCKRNYYICSLATTAIPLIVTIINTIDSIHPEKYFWIPVFISVLSGIVCLISAWLALSRSQESWVRYRTCAEKLKREAMLYLAGIAPYKRREKVQLGNMENDRLLAQNIEKIVQDENQSWEKLQHKKDETNGFGSSLLKDEQQKNM